MRTSLRSALALSLLAVACGGISDPSRTPSTPAQSVSGSLKGADPTATDLRIAIVWRTGKDGGVAVGADSAIVNGQFTLNLAAPPASYYFATDGEVASATTDLQPGVVSAGSDSAGGEATGTNGTSGSTGTKSVHTQGGVGGQVATEMTAALAGFLVYRDKNNNATLDLDGEEIASSDEIVGGNRELMIADLKGGGALDYEKLRDRSGILPHAGMNLFWSEGRWMGLDLVELELNKKNARLANPICSGGAVDTPIAESGPSGSGGTTPAPSTSTPFPATYDAPEDVICSADGRSYRLKNPTSQCTPPTPPPPSRPTVCGGSEWDSSSACAARTGVSLSPGQPVPTGWPCPVAADAGVDADASTVVRDASASTDASKPLTDAGANVLPDGG